MEENKKKKRHTAYYNVPQLKEVYTSPALAVGIAVSQGEEGNHSVRIVIRRDLSVTLSSFTLMCRFSALPLEEKDGENRFYRLVYDKEDINRREYLYVVLNIPAEKFNGGCTALVSAVAFENGKSVSYRFNDYELPREPLIGGDLSAASPLLAEYITYLSNKEKKQGKNPAESRNGAGKQGGVRAERQKTVHRTGRNFFSTPGGVFVAVLAGAAAIAITVTSLSAGGFLNVGQDPEGYSRRKLNNLMAAKDFSEAYQLVSEHGDTDTLQEICEQAAKHFEATKDLDKAYLYASAAPTPFDDAVILSFIEQFIEAERIEEAFDFLSDLGGYDDAMQMLCSAAMEQAISEADFQEALRYAEAAPDSLEETVYQAAEAHLVDGGEINPGALAILQQTDDKGELDSLIAQTVGSVEDFEMAYSLSLNIKDETLRAKTLQSVAMDGMKAYVDEYNLTKAYALYTEAAEHFTEKQKKECLARLLSYSTIQKNTGGVIFFKNLAGESTADITVQAEELSIRGNLENVYFLLTEKQKRDYHAVCFDLYKEAYYILGGALAGTDITDAVSVSTSGSQTIVLHEDGTVSALENDGHSLVLPMPETNDIVQIAAGENHAVFLHSDGTVSGSGSNEWGQINVGGWQNVVKIVAGADFTVGMLADRTLVATGSDLSGQCDVAKYTDVLDIAASDQSLVLLFRDGSVKVVGDASLGLKRADRFNNIKRIRAAASCIIAETDTGTYVMAHEATNADMGSVVRWSKVRYFAAGSLCIGNVDTYGRINIEGDGAPVKGS